MLKIYTTQKPNFLLQNGIPNVNIMQRRLLVIITLGPNWYFKTMYVFDSLTIADFLPWFDDILVNYSERSLFYYSNCSLVYHNFWSKLILYSHCILFHCVFIIHLTISCLSKVNLFINDNRIEKKLFSLVNAAIFLLVSPILNLSWWS